MEIEKRLGLPQRKVSRIIASSIKSLIREARVPVNLLSVE
jgi:DNA-directed RNA polymerase specialized sigma subunit